MMIIKNTVKYESKLKVLHISHTNILSDSRILKEMIALSNSSFDFKLYGIGIDNYEYINNDNYNQHKNLNISNQKLIFKELKFIPLFFRRIFVLIEFYIKAYIHSKKISPNIIHCHDVTALPLCYIINFFLKTKLIYDAHELESMRNGVGKKAGFLVFTLEKFLWKKIDHFISVSPSIIKWYLKRYGAKDNTLILNVPQLEKKNKVVSKISLRKKFNLKKNEVIFVYLGILGKGRNIETLIDSFTNYDIKYNLVFIGDGEYKTKVIQKSKIFSNIHYHKYIKHDELVHFIKDADFGLCLIENISLSDYLCLPNKLFECLNAKLPVLASNFPELSQAIIKNDFGLVCEPTTNSIVKSLKKITKRTFKKNLPKEYFWNYQEKQLLLAYRTLIKDI